MAKSTTQKIDTKIPVIIFEEGSKIIAYSPAIDISTYGNTEEQARKRFIEAASIFFTELIKMGTVDDVLAECGWQKVAPQTTWAPPVYRHIVQESVPIPLGV